MRIAIASEKDDVGSTVCPTAGRAPYYLIFDGSELVKSIKNPFAVGGGGAGFGVAQMLANEGVDVVISGRFGDNMISSLDEKGIRHRVVLDKTINDALEEELSG